MGTASLKPLRTVSASHCLCHAEKPSIQLDTQTVFLWISGMESMLIKDGTRVPLLSLQPLDSSPWNEAVFRGDRVSGRVGRGPWWHCSVKVVSAG